MKRKLSVLTMITIVISSMLAMIMFLNGSANALFKKEASLTKKLKSVVSQSQDHVVDSLTNLDATGKFQYLSGPNAGQPLDIALSFIRNNAQILGVTVADVADLIVTDQYVSQHTGVTHIYLQQQYQGISVYNGLVNVNIAADGSVINVGNRLVTNLAKAVNVTSPVLLAETAVQEAAEALDLSLTKSLEVEQEIGGVAKAVVLGDGGVSQNSIPASLTYFATENGAVRLAWDLEIYELSSLHWWSVRIDAVTGEMISQADYVDYDNWSNEKAEANLNPDDYTVYAHPKESPSDGPRTVEADPADATASPFGWHDTNGASGAEFTTTQGNNVHAYADTDANNSPDPGSSPDGGPGLVFSHTLDLNLQPSTYLTAAVTNLFYWNNIMHDVLYLYGFDEASGNFQENNYSGPGLGSDYVNAEAQDGSGTSNANFATPPDGSNPRMQMFIWTAFDGQLVTVNSPITLTGSYIANPSSNGGTGNGLTADLELVDDGVAPETDGCETINNDLTGKIALIVWNQGACNSSVFVGNAASAGAVAAIIIDNTVLPKTSFGGSSAIPSVGIGQTDGQAFLDAINNGETVNATLEDNPNPTPDRDSDLDNGVIAHEYGHGVSNRLTGGPSQAGCLSNSEQMGEGWSDLMTLILHADAADTSTTVRGVGTYVSFEPVDGLGIRNFPYTTDMAVNPQTYDDIKATGTSPHALGEIWAAMYWEVYWNLVDEYGYNADLYQDWTTGGNNLAMQLLMDGMKLQPCSPGMVDGRDAILVADMALTGGANQCAIWEGFAKRGLGYSADQGSSSDRTDGTEAFDLPLSCSLVNVQPTSQDICVGDTAAYNVALSSLFTNPPVTLSSSGEPMTSTVAFSPNPVPTVPMSATMLITTSVTSPGGTYTLTITATDSISTEATMANLVVFDSTPAASMLTEPSDGAIDQIFHPHFAWSAVPGATGYVIEIATDIGFTNIVETAVVAGTSYDMTSVLDGGTTYYWRVQTANICGTTNSATYSFTTVSASCTTGTPVSYYSEDFDSGAPGWIHSAPTPPDTWVLTDTNPGPGSGGFAYYSQDISSPNEQHLMSPPIELPGGEAQYTLQFLNEQNFEDPSTSSTGCWDGGLLEITTDGGATWIELTSDSDPYDGAGNNGPPSGLNLWCGQTLGAQPWLNSIVNLDAYAGETVQFRFRNVADAAAGAEGWYIDDFQVSACNIEAPIISVEPENMTQDMATDNIVTQTLTIHNQGDGDLDWTIDEEDNSSLSLAQSLNQPIVIGDANALVAQGFVGFANHGQAVEAKLPVGGSEPSISVDGPVTMTHSATQNVVAANSVACPADNDSYFRTFTLGDFGITQALTVSGVRIGVENLSGPGGMSPIEVKLYSWNPATPFVYANLTEIGTSGVVMIPDQALSLVDFPVVGEVPAGGTLVVEVIAMDTAGGFIFFIGSNPDGQTAPSYIASAACGASEPTDIAALGFPGMHIVMNVYGEEAPEPTTCEILTDIPWLSLSSDAGTTVSGTSSLVDVTFDSTSLATGVYTGTLCINSNDSFTPRVEVPVTLTVSAPSYGVTIAPSAAMTDTAGVSVAYTLYVTNTGNTADSFDLSVSGNAWTTTLSDSSVSLGIGESTMVTVTVDISSGAADGEMDIATVTATSQGDGAVSDSAALTTTAVVDEVFIYLPFIAKD